jgi:hypothetical protein
VTWAERGLVVALSQEVRYVPKSITKRDVRAWGKSREFLGGVALCRERIVTAPGPLNGLQDCLPRIWNYRSEWDAFLEGAKAGEFDHLLEEGMLQMAIRDNKERPIWEAGGPMTTAIYWAPRFKEFLGEIKQGDHDQPPTGISRPQDRLTADYGPFPTQILWDITNQSYVGDCLLHPPDWTGWAPEEAMLEMWSGKTKMPDNIYGRCDNGFSESL